MKKGEILKALNEVQHELEKQRLMLNRLLSTPVWSEVVYDEMDETIGVLQRLKTEIDLLMEIQVRVALKPKEKTNIAEQKKVSIPSLLLLSYDEGLPQYEGKDFKQMILEWIQKIEPIARASSPVESTIYIETHFTPSARTWYNLLLEEFGKEFHFTIAKVFVQDDEFIFFSNP